MEEEKRQKEEEIWRQVEIEKKKQSEAETWSEVDDTEGNPVAEAEKKRRVEAQLHENWITDQLTQAAQSKSSKQTTCDFARVALAYWRSQGAAPVNWP